MASVYKGKSLVCYKTGFKKNKTHYSVIYFIVEEVYGVSIQFQTERLEKRDVVSHDFLIRKIKFMHDDRIHMVIR